MQSELATTKAELAKQSEQAALASASSPTSHATVAAASLLSNQGRQQPRRNRQNPLRRGRPTANATSSHSSTLNGSGTRSTTSTISSEAAPQSARIKVEGARKIWGTHPHATTKTVANAIDRFCKVQELRVKRKTSRNAHSRKSSWWFVVHGDEAVLCNLEDKWDCLDTQTSWVLKPCFKLAASEDSTTITAASEDSTPSSAESNAGQLVSNENTISNNQQNLSLAETPNLEPPHPPTSSPSSKSSQPAAEGEPSKLEIPVAGSK